MARLEFASNLGGVRNRTVTLASMVDKAIARSVEGFRAWDVEISNDVIASDSQINGARWDIEEEIVLLIARQAPMARDLRELISFLHIATELERIGDYAKVVARTVLEYSDPPDIKAMPSILDLGALGRSQLADAIEAFLERDAAMARRVAKHDDQMDILWTRIYHQLVAEMIAEPDLVEEASALLWIAHNFERMGDRVTNICERIVYAATGEFEENVHLPDD
jgi:phosphate transport system protein